VLNSPTFGLISSRKIRKETSKNAKAVNKALVKKSAHVDGPQQKRSRQHPNTVEKLRTDLESTHLDTTIEDINSLSCGNISPNAKFSSPTSSQIAVPNNRKQHTINAPAMTSSDRYAYVERAESLSTFFTALSRIDRFDQIYDVRSNSKYVDLFSLTLVLDDEHVEFKHIAETMTLAQRTAAGYAVNAMVELIRWTLHSQCLDRLQKFLLMHANCIPNAKKLNLAYGEFVEFLEEELESYLNSHATLNHFPRKQVGETIKTAEFFLYLQEYLPAIFFATMPGDINTTSNASESSSDFQGDDIIQAQQRTNEPAFFFEFVAQLRQIFQCTLQPKPTITPEASNGFKSSFNGKWNRRCDDARRAPFVGWAFREMIYYLTQTLDIIECENELKVRHFNSH